MKQYNVQIHYEHQDTYVVDTAQFIVPDQVTKEAFASAMLEVTERYNVPDDSWDWTDQTEKMLDDLAKLLYGHWDYITVEGAISVNEEGRSFKA